jgi:ferredoxin
VLSALNVFTDDLAAHVLRGGCGRPPDDVLPVPPAAAGESRLALDWTRCKGHGLCAHIVPELVQPDRQGFPVMLDTPVPPWLERQAGQAVSMCPALALRLVPAGPAQARRGVLARTLNPAWERPRRRRTPRRR